MIVDLLFLEASEARERIVQRNSQLTVIGLGKMGLPLAMVFSNAGYKVKGYDISHETVSMLNDGKTIIVDEPYVQERLRNARTNNLFEATTSIRDAVENSDFILVIIPVLTDKNGSADLTSLVDLYKNLEENCEKGVIYIQESTLPPGTTSGLLKTTLERNQWISGKDFGLVFAPERTFSGRAIDDIETRYPKIIGGDTDNAANIAQLLYEQVCEKGVLKLTNATTAEAVKTFKGAYRDANIAIANQFAILADLYKIDIVEIIEAANSEPFSHIHNPGIGVGGHCIPVYPRFLISQGEEQGYLPNLLSIARNINDEMVDYSIKTLSKYSKNWEDEILIMGISYRGGVKEVRLSPALRLVPQLLSENAKLKVTDPLYSEEEIDKIFGDGTGVRWDKSVIKNYKTLIIVTDHSEFKNIEKEFNNHLIYDGRYVINTNLVSNSIVLQPGRLFLLDETED